MSTVFQYYLKNGLPEEEILRERYVKVCFQKVPESEQDADIIEGLNSAIKSYVEGTRKNFTEYRFKTRVLYDACMGFENAEYENLAHIEATEKAEKQQKHLYSILEKDMVEYACHAKR